MDPKVLKEIGGELKKHRSAAKLSIIKVAKVLKIRKNYLESIENGEFKSLPSNTYVIGYVKQYAKLLGLDSNEIVQRLKGDSDRLKSIASKDLITEKEFLPSYFVLLISLLLAVVLYLSVYWLKQRY